jgi:molecular chaperone GrpE
MRPPSNGMAGEVKDGEVTDATKTKNTKLNGEDQVEETAPPANGVELDPAALAAERDSYLDQLQRAVAEFANYRRRVEQERIQARELATRDVLRQLIPILDDLQRALGSVPEDQSETPWVQGVQLIERKLVSLLEREGVAPIDAVGQPFDPALHEAVASDPGSGGQTVVEVYQTGYRHRNNLLRPAMVRVGDKKDTELRAPSSE